MAKRASKIMNHSNIQHVNNASSFQLPQSKNNFVIHSQLNSFEKLDSNSAFSVKLVLNGTERYKVNDKRYDLSRGDFLIVDQEQELNICFNEQSVAEGMCFYFNRSYLDQFISLSEHGESWGLDHYSLKDQKFDLLSGKFKIKESLFGQYLEKTARAILNNKASIISEDVFIDMSSRLVQQQHNVFKELNQLSSLKMSTRKELYARALIAKHYIEDKVLDAISIEDLAIVSSLSEVQLHRAFRQIFKTSPYQYILTTKLNRAAQLIRSKEQSISAISALLGFADLPTFSKAFKRQFGVAPTLFT